MFFPSVVGVVSSVWPFLVLITVLVFFHELGHYLVARWCGVRVDVFSIGFGPELVGWSDHSGTRWKISIIPLGGYVRFFDEDTSVSVIPGMSSQEIGQEKSLKNDTEALVSKKDTFSGSFSQASLKKRTAIVTAGPLANYLFTFLLMVGTFLIVGERYSLPIINNVVEGMPAYHAGIKAGDRIVSINAVPVEKVQDVAQEMQKLIKKPVEKLPLKIERQQQLLETTVVFDVEKIRKGDALLGVEFSGQATQYTRHTLLSAVQKSGKICWDMTAQLGSALRDIFTGKRSTEELGGILRIAYLSKHVADTGVYTFLWFMAFFSINLGFMNLLPVPGLDGGHLLIYALEKINGKPLTVKAQEVLWNIGFAAVFALMLFSLWNDIRHMRVIEAVLGWVFG